MTVIQYKHGFRAAAGTALLLVIVACGGAGEKETERSGNSATPAADEDFDADDITPQMLALGDSIFHGLVSAGTCQGCHGPDATGSTGIAPNLTDGEWLHSDGSLDGIYRTVQSGVMAPKKFSSVMLPMGGAPLSPKQLRAVAAYVYRLSHKSP